MSESSRPAAPEPASRGRRTALPFAVALLALVAALLLAYAGKAVCIDGETGFWAQTRYCYSDVRVLWNLRGFDVDAVPYTGPPPGYATDYTLEYPPALAFPAWLVALATDSRRGFFNLHAATFAAAAVASLWFLDRALRATGRSRWRLLGFALSPGLVLFGMQNWDLWVVAPVAAGLAAASRRRPYLASVLFGVGAAIKWWPALLLVVVVAGPWRPGPNRGPRRGPRWLRVGPFDAGPALLAGMVWLLTQVPGLAVDPRAWLDAIAFHLRRAANLDSTAAAIAAIGRRVAAGPFWDSGYPAVYTAVSLTILLAGVNYICVRLARGSLGPADAALAAVALFLLTGKVFSPQFIVWLLPVAVLSRVSWTPVVAVESANAVVWLLYGPWLGNAGQGFLHASQGMSIVRTLTLAWLLVAALSARQERPDHEEANAGDGGHQTQSAVIGVPGEQQE